MLNVETYYVSTFPSLPPSGCEDHRAAGDLVLRPAVHRLQELPDVAQAEQEGKLNLI